MRIFAGVFAEFDGTYLFVQREDNRYGPPIELSDGLTRDAARKALERVASQGTVLDARLYRDVYGPDGHMEQFYYFLATVNKHERRPDIRGFTSEEIVASPEVDRDVPEIMREMGLI